MDKLQPYINQFDTFLSKYPLMKDLEAKTGVPKVYAVGATYFLVSISLFFQIYASFVSNLVMLVYPTYRLLESVANNEVDSLKVYGSYLAFFGFLSTLELSGLFAYYIPFYFVIRSVVGFWLYWPPYNGMQKVLTILTPHLTSLVKKTEPKAE